MKLTENKGIGLSDAIIAIAIFVIFSGIIISISYNIYLQSNFIKRNNNATNYIIEALEYAKGLNFDNFSDTDGNGSIDNEIQADIISHFATKEGLNVFGILTENELSTNLYQYKGFIMQIDVKDIHNENQEEYEENFVKQITITVHYKLGGKIKNVSMSTLIAL